MDTYRTMKILAILAASFTTALYIELPSPTLSNLRILFNTSYEEIGRSFGGRAVGAVIASLAGWKVLEKMSLSLDLLIGLLQIVASITVAVTPICTDLNELWLAFCVTGFCFLLTHMAVLQLSLQMSTSNNPYLVYMMFLSYPIGACIVPIVAVPFLSAPSHIGMINSHANRASNAKKQQFETEPLQSSRYVTNMTLLTGYNQTVRSHGDHIAKDIIKSFGATPEVTRVQWAFLVVAVVTMLSGLITCISYIWYSLSKQVTSYKPVLQTTDDELNRTVKEAELNDTPSNKNKASEPLKRNILLYLFTGTYFAVENNCKNQLTIFAGATAITLFGISSKEASYLTLLYWVATIVGRIVSAVCSSFLSLRKQFTLQIFLFVMSCLTFTVFGPSSFYMFSASAIFTAFASSPLLPLGVRFVNDVLFDMKDRRLLVFYVGRNVGELTGTWLIAALFDYYGPPSMFYMIDCIAITLLFICIFMQFVSKTSSRTHIT